MALCVSPPPHGFSQARCSSNTFTLCPARASCSPHIEPEGPPPMIAISAITIFSLRSANSSFEAKLAARKSFAHRTQMPGCSGYTSSGDGEDHQTKTSQEYSTEYRGRRSGAGLLSHNVHPPALERVNQSKIRAEQHHQECPAMEIENTEREHTPGHQ